MVRRADERLTAIEAVYRAKYGDFVRVATAITGDAHCASEAVQQAFADAIRTRHAFRGDGPMAAWIWRAVVRSARRLAAEPRVTSMEEAAVGPSPNGEAAGDAAVRVAVGLLPERQRMAVFLRYFADLEYGQIAEILNVSVGTVSASLHAAHASLRAALQSEEVPS